MLDGNVNNLYNKDGKFHFLFGDKSIGVQLLHQIKNRSNNRRHTKNCPI